MSRRRMSASEKEDIERRIARATALDERDNRVENSILAELKQHECWPDHVEYSHVFIGLQDERFFEGYDGRCSFFVVLQTKAQRLAFENSTCRGELETAFLHRIKSETEMRLHPSQPPYQYDSMEEIREHYPDGLKGRLDNLIV